MVDYNDGEWHGWNGGECPVHPESLIELRTTSGYHETDRKAGITAWAKPKLFRVTKPYVEPPKPREFWINEYDWGFGGAYHNKADADESASNNRIRCFHVREVIEE